MGENSAIEWTDHTFNPWIGCTKVSAGCDRCYAETLATNRLGVAWGPHAERRRTADSTWRQPLAWNRKAEREGKRARVFCASLADVFDNQVPEQWRLDLWALIHATPHLDWLLLTKRPQNIAKMLPAPATLGFPAWGQGWPNVWLGTTVENQAEADRRIWHLLAAPARVRFLSCEPLVGPVKLDLYFDPDGACCGGDESCYGNGRCHLTQWPRDVEGEGDDIIADYARIHWIIAGGESGPGARPMHPDWARGLRDQCQAAGVPFFFKQWGDWRPISQGDGDWYDGLYRSNRAAEPGEDQANLDEIYGRRCTVRKAVIHHDGSATDVAAPDSWEGGTGAMLTFQVGKKAAGAMLDGREWREVPLE